MLRKSLKDLSDDLKSKDISSVEIAQFYIKRIKELNTKFNAFITLDEENALKSAQLAQEQINQGQGGLLTGLPIAHKDIFCTKDLKTSCGSKMLDNFIAPYDATMVDNLKRLGVVMLGKTNMDEFAMGSSNENSYYGPVKNPWDLERVPGGSSGGSAAAVAARMVPCASGTDTGGSIRQPAAFCGITGLKPTYGRISRYGMVAFASSLDQGGPMTIDAQDAALMLQGMAGFDAKDSTSIDRPVPNYLEKINQSLKGVKIGLPKEYFEHSLAPDIEQQLRQAIDVYKDLGAELVDISLPNSPLAVAVYYVVACAESSSNLSRFDGVRYGYRCEGPVDLEDLYKRSRSEGFGEEVKRRIMVGTYALSAGYFDAYYLQAQKVRMLIAEDFEKAFEKVDCILGPTAPTTAFKIGEKISDPVSMYLNDIFTIATNLVGLPGISIPCGLSEGLPIGLQLMTKHFEEAKLLNIAHMYQTQTDWHQRLPSSIA